MALLRWQSPINLLVAFSVSFLVDYWIGAATAREFNMLTFEPMTVGGQMFTSTGGNQVSYYALPIAVQHFNTRDGSIVPELSMLKACNSTVNIVGGLFDEQSLASVGISHFIEPLGNGMKIDLIHGPGSDTVTQTVGIAAGALEIPLISFLSTAEKFNDALSYPTFFKIQPTDGEYARAAAALFDSFQYNIIAILHSSDVSGTSMRDILTLECQARGIRVQTASFDGTKTGAALQADLSAGIQSFIQARINVIYRWMLTLEQELLYAEVATNFSYVKNRLHVGHYGTTVVTAIQAAGTYQDMYKAFLLGSLAVSIRVDSGIRGYTRLLNAWQTFNATFVNQFLPNTTTLAGEPYQIPSDYFQATPLNPAYQIVALAYDSMIALCLATCGPSTNLTANMRNVQFRGASGHVEFTDDLTRLVDNGGFYVGLENFLVLESDPVIGVYMNEVATFANGTWNFSSEILFNDGTNNPPIDVQPPHDFIDKLPQGVKALAYVEGAVGIIAGLWAMGHLWIKPGDFADSKSRVDLIVLGLAVILLSISVISLTLQSSAGCMLYLWFFTLGFTSSLAVLFSKAVSNLLGMRLTKQQKSNTETSGTSSREILRNSSVGLLAFIVLAVLGILIAFQVVAPLTYSFLVTEVDSYGNTLAAVEACIPSEPDSTSFNLIIIIVIIVMCVLTFLLALIASNAPSYDAKMTAVASVCIFEVFFVALPTLFAVSGTSLPRFLVESSLAFLTAMIVIFTMFLPRVYKWHFRAFNLIPLVRPRRISRDERPSVVTAAGQSGFRTSAARSKEEMDFNAPVKQVPGFVDLSMLLQTSAFSKAEPTSFVEDSIPKTRSKVDTKPSPAARLTQNDFANIPTMKKTLPSFVNFEEIQAMQKATATRGMRLDDNGNGDYQTSLNFV